MNPALTDWIAFAGTHPHDFTIQYPPRREYFQQHFRESPPAERRTWLVDAPEILLYLHVPFCEARCFYCNFAVDTSADAAFHSRYVDALLRELERNVDWLNRTSIKGIDIGGGTPTRLAQEQLARICQAVGPFASRCAHPFPTSIETTPWIAAEQPEKMALLAASGVRRVSMGVQSMNVTTLALVNRRRQVEQAAKGMANLRSAGFSRVNLDIIFGLPGQTLSDWESDLERIIDLGPDSITTYDCLYRGKGRALTKISSALPSPFTYGQMYNQARERLTAAGWCAPYGSVNFSRRSDETGTSACFEGRLLDGLPYLGLGNYATSLRGDRWSFNAPSARGYIDLVESGRDPTEFSYLLPREEAQAKYVLYSLNYGFIDDARFTRRFGAILADCYPEELEHATRAGLLSHREGRWQLVEGRFDAIPIIRSLFYPRQARIWLMSLHG